MSVNYTFRYEDDNEPIGLYPSVLTKTDLQFEDGTTWVNVVESFLQFLEGHYGYNIREQVFYSVAMPFNDPNESRASGREMDRTVFEKLVLENPDLIPSSQDETYK